MLNTSAPLKHPVAARFNYLWEGTKHIAEKAIKWAVIIGLAAAAVTAGCWLIPAGTVGGVGAMLGGVIDLVGTVVPFVGGGYAAAATSGTLLNVAGVGLAALKIGALVGAGAGALLGVSSLSGAMEEKLEDRIAQHNSLEMRQRQNQAFAMSMNQMQQPAMPMQQMQQVNPGLGMPQMGRGGMGGIGGMQG